MPQPQPQPLPSLGSAAACEECPYIYARTRLIANAKPSATWDAFCEFTTVNLMQFDENYD